jgi:hypothetical protein
LLAGCATSHADANKSPDKTKPSNEICFSIVSRKVS